MQRVSPGVYRNPAGKLVTPGQGRAPQPQVKPAAQPMPAKPPMQPTPGQPSTSGPFAGGDFRQWGGIIAKLIAGRQGGAQPGMPPIPPQGPRPTPNPIDAQPPKMTPMPGVMSPAQPIPNDWPGAQQGGASAQTAQAGDYQKLLDEMKKKTAMTGGVVNAWTPGGMQ